MAKRKTRKAKTSSKKVKSAEVKTEETKNALYDLYDLIEEEGKPFSVEFEKSAERVQKHISVFGVVKTDPHYNRFLKPSKNDNLIIDEVVASIEKNINLLTPDQKQDCRLIAHLAIWFSKPYLDAYREAAQDQKKVYKESLIDDATKETEYEATAELNKKKEILGKAYYHILPILKDSKAVSLVLKGKFTSKGKMKEIIQINNLSNILYALGALVRRLDNPPVSAGYLEFKEAEEKHNRLPLVQIRKGNLASQLAKYAQHECKIPPTKNNKPPEKAKLFAGFFLAACGMLLNKKGYDKKQNQNKEGLSEPDEDYNNYLIRHFPEKDYS
jgi:hypothetical protein